ncbi:MAG TPA: radical SAM protein [Chloroflexota bacterium]
MLIRGVPNLSIKRVLLVEPHNPNLVGFYETVQVEPLALEFVAGAVSDLVEVEILDLRVDRDLEGALRRFNPDVVGIRGGYTADVPPVLDVAARVKAFNPSIWVVVGGHHASLNPAHFFSPSVDFVVIGEGERPFRHLITVLGSNDLGKLEQVQSVWWRKDGTFVLNGRLPKEKADMDERPRPRRDLVEKYRKEYFFLYHRAPYSVETARGCRFRCTFCSVWRFHEGAYKVESAQRTIEEIASLPGSYINFVDDLAFNNHELGLELANGLIQSGIKKRYWAQCRSDDVVRHPEVFERLAEAGLDMVLMGLESVDQEMLKRIRKGNKIDNNIKAIEILHSLKVKIWGAFIVDPAWDETQFKQLADFVNAYNIECPQFTILTPLPGTVLYEEVKDQLITHDPSYFDFLHTVLPTKLPLDQFYQQIAKLYHETGMKLGSLRELLRSGEVTMDQLRDFLKRFASLTDLSTYARGLELRPQGSTA